MSLNVTRLTPALGALVQGVDLSGPMSAQVQREIREALVRHQVLFFRRRDELVGVSQALGLGWTMGKQAQLLGQAGRPWMV